MTTDEQIAEINRKLDLILNTFGIREALARESQLKINTMAAMKPEELHAHLKAKTKALRRR